MTSRLRVNLGALVIAGALVLAGLWISTQSLAAKLHYSRHLGEPLLRWADGALYTPWAWLGWSQRFSERLPDLFSNAFLTTAVAVIAAFLVAAVVVRVGAPPKTSTAHGSARWAETRELRRAGLLRSNGVVLCQTADAELRPASGKPGETGVRLNRPGTLIRHAGPEHAMVFAPTRSGKGVGVVMPTLLSWTESAIIHDTKKELWHVTAGWRRKFSRCVRFEPTARDSVRYNPLMEVRRGEEEVKDVQNIADILIDPSGEKTTRSHWETTAHDLLVGTLLHVLYAEKNKTLRGVSDFLSDPNRTAADTFMLMMQTPHLPAGPHPVVAAVARRMLNRAFEEQSGVLSTAVAALSLFEDPLIARATSESDFRITDLMDGDAPMSLYLVIPPSDIIRTTMLSRLLLNQMARRLCEDLGPDGQSSHKHKLLMLLDEFPLLGRMQFFESALAFVAGYGIKCLLVAQSLNQLAKHYGERNSILDNCHVRLAYASNDDLTNRRISDLLGQSTHLKTQRSFRGLGLLSRNRTDSEQEHPRPLLTPGEVGQLSSDEAVLFVGGMPPYRAKKSIYYADPRFKGRAKLPPPNSPTEQAAELPAPRPTDWTGVVRSQPAAAPDAVPAPEAASSRQPPRKKAQSAAAQLAVDENPPTEAAAEPLEERPVLAEWGDILGADDESPSDDQLDDSPGVQPGEELRPA